MGLGAAALKTAGELEQNQIAFKTMLGSADQAQQHLNELKDFALKTPFQFNDLVTASKRMQAYGISAKEVLPTLRSIGDAAAALGLGAEGIDRIVRALGQMKAKGMVQAEEMRQLAEAGIPAWQILAKTLNTDVAGAMKQVEARTVDAATAVPALLAGMNEKFGGLMEAQSKTLLGQFSNLKDAITFTLQDIGATLAPIAGRIMDNAIKPLLEGFKNLAAGFAAMTPAMQNFIITGAALAAAIGPITLGLGLFANSLTAIAGLAAYLPMLLNPVVVAFGSVAVGAALATIEFDRATEGLRSLNDEFDKWIAKQVNPTIDLNKQRDALAKALQQKKISLEEYNATLDVIAEKERKALVGQDFEKSELALRQALDSGAIGLSKFNSEMAILEDRQKKAVGALWNSKTNIHLVGGAAKKTGEAVKQLADYTLGESIAHQALERSIDKGHDALLRYATGQEKVELASSDTSAVMEQYRWALRNSAIEAVQLTINQDPLREGIFRVDAIMAQFGLTSKRAMNLAYEATVALRNEVAALMMAGKATQSDVENMDRVVQDSYDRMTGAAKKGARERATVERGLAQEIQDLNRRTFTDMERGIAKSIVDWKGWKETLLGVMKSFATGALEIIFKELLKPLEDKLSDIISGIKGGASKTATNAISGGGSSVAGGAAGAASGGLTGLLTTVFTGISAFTGVVGMFQGMHQETSLNAIEYNTRVSAIYLGQQEGGGIFGYMKLAAGLLGNIKDYLWSVQADYLRQINDSVTWGKGQGGGNGKGLIVNFYGPVNGSPQAIANAIFDQAALAGAI